MIMRLLTTTVLAVGLLLPAAAGAQQSTGDSPAGKRSQQELQNQQDRQSPGTQSGTRDSTTDKSSAKSGDGLNPATEADRRTWTKDKLVGKPLYGADANEIGTIEDVVAGPAGEVEAVLVDVGGFLGIGSKRVAVPIEEVSLYEDRAVVAGLTKTKAENMNEYEAKTPQ